MSEVRWPFLDYLTPTERDDLRAIEAHQKWLKARVHFYEGERIVAKAKRTLIVNRGTQRAIAAGKRND